MARFVHCVAYKNFKWNPGSDGVGRTGAFITIHAQMEHMKAEAVVNIFQFIKAIRIQRAGMVSNKVAIIVLSFL